MKFDFFSLSRFHMAAICFDIVARASPNLERKRRRKIGGGEGKKKGGGGGEGGGEEKREGEEEEEGERGREG